MSFFSGCTNFGVWSMGSDGAKLTLVVHIVCPTVKFNLSSDFFVSEVKLCILLVAFKHR